MGMGFTNRRQSVILLVADMSTTQLDILRRAMNATSVSAKKLKEQEAEDAERRLAQECASYNQSRRKK